MIAPVGSYNVGIFRGQTRQSEIEHLSIDAARHIAQTHAGLGDDCRVMLEGGDYCEVYMHNGDVRIGTYADTTLVRVTEEGQA